MLIIHPPKAISKCCTHEQTTMSQQLSPSSITPGNFLINIVVFDAHMRNHCNQRGHSSFRSWKCCSEFRSSNLSRIPNRSALNKWLDFISAGVNAYALGCTDEGVRKELIDMKDSGVDIEGIETHGGRTQLKSKILSKEVDECILWLSIIFITILCTPQPTVVRWSSTTPVSNEIMLQWKGFCALIANAYYVKGMAWLPVKTLQLEQMAVVGYAEEPSIVASRMLLVFTTLEVVSPQWPRV